MKSPAAARMQRLRRRERLGLRQFTIEVDHFRAVDWLVYTGRITESDTSDDAAIGAALEKLVAQSISYKKV